MDMPRPLTLAAVLAGLLLAGSARSADEAKPPDDAKPLGTDGCNNTFARAGYPDETSCFAKLGRRPNYCGYYVGGGCVCGPVTCHGSLPAPYQGTYGWDYCCGPCGLNHRVILGWCFGCRPKGGTGAYKTDGPHVPNPLALKLPPAECDSCSHR
jgi:hypothetical protein